MRTASAILAALLCLPLTAAAQDVIPDRFVTLTRDVDFPGGDLRPIFDTTLSACEAACRADPDCVGFTYNGRNGACFPKSDLSEPVAYQNAISGEMRPVAPGVLDRLDARLAALAFLREDDLVAAREQALGMGRAHYAGQFTAEAWREAAAREEAAGNLAGAARMMGAAVTRSDAAADWADHARLTLAIEGGGWAERQERTNAALSAAVNAGLRAAPGAELAAALDVLAQALERAERGGDAIPALRLAMVEAGTADRAAALDRLVGLFGFRVVETQVDGETDFPRICAVFSEPLAAGGVIWSDFVQTTDTGLSVEAEDRQLCIAGVQHGARYEVTLRAGLPAASGEVLQRPVPIRQYVRDRAPSVRFEGRAYILAASAGGALPIVGVNADTVELTLYAVSDRNILRSLQEDYFGQPLRAWQFDFLERDIAERVWEGTAEIAREQNRAVTTRLPMDAVLEGLPPGLYALEARVEGAGTDGVPATQWFLVSDLGLSVLTGSDGVHVVVRGLADAGPRPGVTVALVSESNRVLAETVTDADGYARFEAGLARGTGGAAPALVSVRDGETDFAFLSLREAEFDLSDRGVEGRAPANPVDVFLTTERGAYRAGEVIHATALARDPQAQAVTGLPLTAILSRADGVEYSRTLVTEAGAGGYAFSLPIGTQVPRGTWRLALHADPDAPALAETSVLVEDFLPERLDLVLDMDAGPFAPGDRPILTLQADYLFGAPAADLAVEGQVALRPVSTLDAFPGYSFGRHDAAPEAAFAGLGALRSDAVGAGSVRVEVPALQGAPQPGLMTVTATITEGSGRPVERRITRPVMPEAPLIGIRPLFDDVLPEGAEAGFRLIAVNATALPVRWTVNRVDRRYQWYQQNGNWSWEPVTTRSRVAEGTAVLGTEPVDLSVPLDWGDYELRVETDEGGHALSSVGFAAGWYGATEGTDTPDVLEVSLDADSYAAGDTAMLRIVPRQGGLALVQVVSDRLIAMQMVEIGDDPTEIALPVTADWGSGAYVTATLIRPLSAVSGPVPARALGLAHATVAPGARALAAALDLPATAQPRGPLEVVLRVDGAREGETVYATLAAVDLGILNLTGFDAPDPQGYFFGQRRLGVAFRDVYGRLIDARDGAEGRIRQGGDGGAGLRMQAPPPTEELLAEFSGPVTVGADGTARVSFDLPAFNGTVRVMAVAWSETGVGQASGDVLVRDPVVVTASLPRFLSPGDTGRMLLELTHAEGPVGEVALAVTTTGGLSLGGTPAPVMLGAQETARLSLPVTALDGTDVERVTVAATLPDGRVLTRELSLPVQVNDPEIAETSRIALAPGQSFTLDAQVFAGTRAGTGRAMLAAGPLARFDAAGLLARLDAYPWGCTEQVTSQAMPLLYLSSVAEALDLGTAGDLSARIDDAIGQVLVNQAGNGSFGLWRAGGGDLWLDAYVTDFLSRARAEGHTVPAIPFRLALDNLANEVAAHGDFENGGEGLAYALMVLAREGQASMGDLRYYADVKADSFATPLALGQLGAALAMYGDQPRADAMFRAGFARLRAAPEPELWRVDYGTPARDAAGLVALAAAAGSDTLPDPAALLAAPADAVSTQEAVWTLLAAHALIDNPAAEGLMLDGAPVSGPLVEALRAGDTTTRTVTNTGPREEVLTLTRFGLPEGGTEQFGNRYRIDRDYLTLEGAPADPATVRQGTRMVVLLTVTPLGAPEGRLMVTDPLPAGFEIDNPNLLASGDVRGLQGIDLTAWAEHTEFRQDRFLAAIDSRSQDPLRLAYIVRAVTPGSFHHPAAGVEDMYRPAYRAQTASGRVVVTE
ncbi:alpha-2-macroglobulin family protein [Roseicyclus persicicus]|uniref:Alpha-2-macroglobulin family protein n=1 Tax=Roseicyclus persicicus TaxID=2650661 RepID=A0A7X6H0L4_9RHOB|nr:alpha-2-macroglobulin family protein [Roseibacterium persicicum]NKX45154.1 alpha-2-macroglobulin family protein [Roseibacterium persicicum]